MLKCNFQAEILWNQKVFKITTENGVELSDAAVIRHALNRSSKKLSEKKNNNNNKLHL